MVSRVGLLLLFLLSASWCCDARQLTKSGPEIQLQYEAQDGEIRTTDVTKNEKICTLCEEYAAQALFYFKQNKTQIEIIEILHKSCSQLHSLKIQCTSLVDYYAPLFFQQLALIQPENFCEKVNLCQEVVMISTQLREDSCGLCHHAVSDVLVKLKDPDTQLEIIEVLLKGCNSMKGFEKKCKRMVFEFGPLILTNTEQYLEKNDICTALHACNSPAEKSDSGEKLLSDA